MRKLNQYLPLTLIALLLAGTANAQAPTNTYQGNPIRSVATPDVVDYAPNPTVSGAPAGTYSRDYNNYSQDSYVKQTGSSNYAEVDQTDNRTAFRGNGAGSTAVLIQNGENNRATQRQTLADQALEQDLYNPTSSPARNFMKSTQNGSASQTDQTQNGGNNNVMEVTQGAGTTGNRAIQSQGEFANRGSNYGSFNQAIIAQTGSGNRAEQTQGGLYETGQITQASTNSYAKQTQLGFYNDADIVQGAGQVNNTAIQSQTRGTGLTGNAYGNNARIDQSTGSNNYAMQNQTGYGNQADITQRSSGNFARQDQAGNPNSIGYPYPNNISVITQANVASAAYTTQTGDSNTVIVTQH